MTDMQNAASAGQVPGTEHDLQHPEVFSLCHCMLEWKRGSFQWMLTDCLQKQYVLEERLDSVKVQAAADG